MTNKIKNRIEKLSKEEMLSNWEHNFLESLIKWVEKGNHLSHRQNTTLQNIEAKYSEDKKAALEAWKESYTSEMRENMTIMAHYYINNPPYFGDIARRVMSDKERSFIPSEKVYRAMCETNTPPALSKSSKASLYLKLAQWLAFELMLVDRLCDLRTRW